MNPVNILSKLNKLILGNKTIYKFSGNDLILFKPIIPDEQRIRDTDKVKDIINYQLDYKQNNNCFNFLGVINIHHLLSDDEYYLVDGQHRFEAIKELDGIHKQREIEIMVEIISVKTLDDLKHNYKLINKNTPLPEFSEKIDKYIPEQAALHFKKEYPNLWSKSKRPQRPHLNFNYFQESLGFLVERLPNIDSSKKLIEIMESWNTDMSHWEFSNLSEEQYKKSQTAKFYLGCARHTSDEWGYEWVKDIIRIETGINLKSQHKKKKAIPKALKTEAWNKYVGKEKGEVLCVCCMSRTIQQAEFHAGHILSEAMGGKVTLDNILPICGQCNNSMKTTHMRNYIEEHYPDNLSFFEERNYLTPDEWEEFQQKNKMKKEKSGGFLSRFKKK
jgi:hypothetical protein